MQTQAQPTATKGTSSAVLRTRARTRAARVKPLRNPELPEICASVPRGLFWLCAWMSSQAEFEQLENERDKRAFQKYPEAIRSAVYSASYEHRSAADKEAIHVRDEGYLLFCHGDTTMVPA